MAVQDSPSHGPLQFLLPLRLHGVGRRSQPAPWQAFGKAILPPDWDIRMLAQLVACCLIKRRRNC